MGKLDFLYFWWNLRSSHGVFAFSHEKIKAIFNLENGQPARNFISIEKYITPTISILILIQIDFETSKIQLFSCNTYYAPLNLSTQNNWFICKRGQNTGCRKKKIKMIISLTTYIHESYKVPLKCLLGIKRLYF